MKSKNSVRLLGPTRAEGRAPTVALTANRPGADLAEALAPHEINAGGGDFYAVRPLKALGVGEEGVLRLSFVHYTSEGDIDRLIRALDHVL